MPKLLSKDSKQEAVRLYRQGKSWFSVCFTCNISKTELYRELKRVGQPLQSNKDFKLELAPRTERNELAEMVKELEDNNVSNPRVVDDFQQPLKHRKGA